MKPLPTDPLARHARFMAALCDDFASPEFLRTGKTPRADAVAAVSSAEHLPTRTQQQFADFVCVIDGRTIAGLAGPDEPVRECQFCGAI